MFFLIFFLTSQEIYLVKPKQVEIAVQVLLVYLARLTPYLSLANLPVFTYSYKSIVPEWHQHPV